MANGDFPLWLQTTDVLLDALAAASWPIAVVAVLLTFREPLTGLLSRMRKLNGFGSEAEFIPVEAATAQKAVAAPSDNAALAVSTTGQGILELPPADLVLDTFDQAAQDILENNVPGTPERKLAWAIRMRSISEAGRIHETNYRLIFGSQIAALKTLNVLGQAPASEFEPFFQKASANPDWEQMHKGRTFDDWGQFLIDAHYVELVPDTDPLLVRITPFGRQFLGWMTNAQVSEFKPG